MFPPQAMYVGVIELGDNLLMAGVLQVDIYRVVLQHCRLLNQCFSRMLRYADDYRNMREAINDPHAPDIRENMLGKV